MPTTKRYGSFRSVGRATIARVPVRLGALRLYGRVPRRVRFLLAVDHAPLSRILAMDLRKVFAYQKRAARRLDITALRRRRARKQNEGSGQGRLPLCYLKIFTTLKIETGS